MNDRRKVCVVTGSRAEYGLLYCVMKEMQKSVDIELQVVVTGSHLSPEFGLTYKQIEQDGFVIDRKINMLLSSDSDIGISKSMGLGMIGFADAVSELSPNLIVVVGDRFEIFSIVATATVARIPIAHIHGGETTEGVFDESFRHSITKMSHLHFTSTDTYRNRVIQLGEHPDRVFNVGAVGIDNIKQLKLFSQKELERCLGFRLCKHNVLVTFHPVTLEESTSKEHFSSLLEALDELENIGLIFTKANADTDGHIINKMIDEYVGINSHKAVSHKSLGQVAYLSTLKHVNGVVGNSSSGLIEAPSFNIGTVNIGNRQRGRIMADSVINCGSKKEEIKLALTILFSDNFKKQTANVINPHGVGGAASKIVEIIKNQSLNKLLMKKFYDL
jgi:GDP/UDP-N,N'-diacetylbacillosamine 2-epimerase (hydrolysing)